MGFESLRGGSLSATIPATRMGSIGSDRDTKNPAAAFFQLIGYQFGFR
jgi:hypothetical protein